MPYKIFINYRRDDSSLASQIIYSKLVDKYDKTSVFKDLDIAPGENFEERIENELTGCKIFIAVIGKDWLTELKKRIGSGIDYVIAEIKIALENNKHIIPVLIGGTIMPGVNDVPETIQLFCKINAISINPNNLDADLGKLLRAVANQIRKDAPPKNVLVLDSSAARGSITLGMLYSLEKKLNENEPQFKSLANYFDLFVSSGPSSFIAVMLASGRNVSEITELYFGFIRSLYQSKFHWLNIFEVGSFMYGSYKSGNALVFLENHFRDMMVEDKSFKSYFGVFSFNIDEEDLHVFSNLKVGAFDEQKSILIKDILMSSSVSPTYHKPYSLRVNENTVSRFINGSVGTTSNPTLNTAFYIQSVSDLLQWNMNSDQLFFLSVGAGLHPNWGLKSIKNVSLLQWAQALPDLLLRNSSANNDTLFTMVSKGFVPDNNSQENFRKAIKDSLKVSSYLFSSTRINADLNDSFTSDEVQGDNYEDMIKLYEWSKKNTAHLMEKLQIVNKL